MKQYICGKNSVMDAINNKLPIETIYTSGPIVNLDTTGIKVQVVTKEALNKMTDAYHQGIIAELKEFNYYDVKTILADQAQRVLVLDHIQDPHNLGAILRSANAFGFNHIIIPKDRAATVNATVLKVCSGGQVGLKIIKVNSLLDAVQMLKKNNFWVYSSAITEKAKELNDVQDFASPTILVVGNESTGVSKTLLNVSDEIIYIPMRGSVQSLNVSVATGILMSRI